MNRGVLCGLVVVGFFLAFSVFCCRHALARPCREEKLTTGVKPLMTLYGRNSKVTREKVLRIMSEKEWKALWAEHKVGSPAPASLPDDFEYAEIDFGKLMAIAVFDGEGIGCGGYTAHSICEGRDQIIVRLLAHTWQTGFLPGVPTPKTQAWGVLVMPLSRKAIVLERDVRSLIADPPKWEKWKTLPGVATERK